MDIEIRKAGVEQLELLMQWRMRVLAEVFAGEPADEAELCVNNEAYYREHLADGTHTACFAADSASGQIVGCGGICYQEEMPSPDNPAGTNGYLMNIYTLPELRGGGVGRKIIEYLIEDARARGTGKIYLESSRMARALYEEMGFTGMEDYMKL